MKANAKTDSSVPPRSYLAEQIGEEYARAASRWHWSEVEGSRTLVVEFPPGRNLTLVVMVDRANRWQDLLAHVAG